MLMARYWVVAPVESNKPELFDKVWQFDMENNLISIGWSEVGNVSNMDRETLSKQVATVYPDKPQQTKSLIANMLWAFYHEVKPADVVIARRGRKNLAALGKVIQPGFYSPGKDPYLASADYSHPNFLGVEWQPAPRDQVFRDLVFPMHTLSEFTESQYENLLTRVGMHSATAQPAEPIDEAEFALEKYLEDFIVSNFDIIFKGKLKIYEDAAGADGQQYPTEIGPIDILAVDPKTDALVVIELKKGRPSDHVVGQILRYMGWVKKKLCKNGQMVRGLIICRDPDPKLSYALEMTQNIEVRYYNVSFKLREIA
jgi:RecB family endonuclease NucS